MDSATLVARKSNEGFQYYYYQPSLPAAAIFVVLFGVASAVHAYKMGRTRTWFMIPFLIGGIFETIGYVGRILSARQNPPNGPYTEGPFIIQSVLLLVAPALFAASIYMELGRIVLMVRGEKNLFIRRTWLTKIFVIGDVVSFLLQAGGAGLLASGNQSMINTGNNIVIVGLFFQIVFFGLFVVASLIFHLRMRKAPTQLSYDRPWTKHMMSLYVVSILIFVRSIVRTAEYIEGYGGYLMSREVYLYVFDAVPMFFAVVCMIFIHPGEVKKYVRLVKGSNETVEEGQTRLNEMA